MNTGNLILTKVYEEFLVVTYVRVILILAVLFLSDHQFVIY